jgi:hypothetical protein
MKLNVVMDGKRKENTKYKEEERRKAPVNAMHYGTWSRGSLGQVYQKCSLLIAKGTD